MEDNPIYRINWVDGMKMNKDHFLRLENSLLQSIAQSNTYCIANRNYGLVPIPGEKPFKIELSVDGRHGTTITILSCNAVTKGGYSIIINEEITRLLEQSSNTISCHKEWTDEKDGVYQVLLSVSPLERIAIGSADPEEEPVRKPFVIPKYRVSVVPMVDEQIEETGAFDLIIGLISVEKGIPTLQENYIPPCTTVKAHSDLFEIYQYLGGGLNTLEALSMKIIQKIYKKKQSNDLARMVLSISRDLQLYLSHAIPAYRIHDLNAEPTSMVSRLAGVARTLQGSVNMYAGTGKEILLTYLSEWCQLNQGEFEEVLTSVSQLDYKHYNIQTSIELLEKCNDVLVQLFRKLEELEYIGKKSNSKLFVKEDVIDEEPKNTTGKFFLEE
ncbi:hypothetical protein H0I23_00850 [Cellulophaga sp. HaHaR_3_176]|uniref:hypothetical protein n=1 Tax=Cellulophaga sp. HaHaR_3_176 TaxID=1942464 RepID=UPI001C1F35A2|nr:hypothetical protein [Cellulophaga sp. HaHaR_3_176]QWX84231.1 hypothetical protein H0I23_00850 [Cellulophaga sp. HaHaR_3_176]